MKLKVFALFLLCACVSGRSSLYNHNATPGCDMSQEAMMKIGMQCLSKDPALMVQVIKHMDDPDSMASMKFVCKNQKEVIDVTLCVLDKLSVCISDDLQMSSIESLLRERLEDTLSFVCQHQAELNDDCMDSVAVEKFTNCLNGSFQSFDALIATKNFGLQDLTAMGCKLLSSYETCHDAHHGTCSKEFTSLVDQVFTKMIPENMCSAVDVNAQKHVSDLKDSLLLRGMPLKFYPENEGGEYKN